MFTKWFKEKKFSSASWEEETHWSRPQQTSVHTRTASEQIPRIFIWFPSFSEKTHLHFILSWMNLWPANTGPRRECLSTSDNYIMSVVVGVVILRKKSEERTEENGALWCVCDNVHKTAAPYFDFSYLPRLETESARWPQQGEEPRKLKNK